MRTQRKRTLGLTGFGVLVVASVLGLAAPAQAHNYVVSSTPTADATLTALPENFEITTNDTLLDLGGGGAGFAIQVKDAGGLFYGDGCVTISGPSITTPAALGAAGEYEVLWQVVSADGHTISDEFSFTWAPPADFVPSEGSATAPNCGGTAAPEAGSGEETPAPAPQNAPLGDVLWIGGAILVVVLAVGVTILLTGRKQKGSAPDSAE